MESRLSQQRSSSFAVRTQTRVLEFANCASPSWSLGHKTVAAEACQPGLSPPGAGRGQLAGLPCPPGSARAAAGSKEASHRCHIDRGCHAGSLLSPRLAQNQPLSLPSQAVLTPGDRILMCRMAEASELMCAWRDSFECQPRHKGLSEINFGGWQKVTGRWREIV